MPESKLIRVEDLEKMYQDRIDYFVKEGMATGDPDLHTIAGAVSGCLRIAKELVPTADAIEVVRCKDCKWSKVNDGTWEDGMIICTCGEAHDENFGVTPDGFCNYGERKGQE